VDYFNYAVRSEVIRILGFGSAPSDFQSPHGFLQGEDLISLPRWGIGILRAFDTLLFDLRRILFSPKWEVYISPFAAVDIFFS